MATNLDCAATRRRAGDALTRAGAVLSLSFPRLGVNERKGFAAVPASAKNGAMWSAFAIENGQFIWPNGARIRTDQIASLTRRHEISQVVIAPNSIDVIHHERTFAGSSASWGVPIHQSSTPVAGMLSGANRIVKNRAVLCDVSATCQRVAGLNQIMVSASLWAAASESAALLTAIPLRWSRGAGVGLKRVPAGTLEGWA